MAKNKIGAIVDDGAELASAVLSATGSTGNGVPNDQGSAQPDEPEFIHGFESVEPTGASGASGADGGTGKRRGRPTSTARAAGPKKAGDINAIEALLLSVHTIGAAILDTPELAIAPDEAKALGDAISRVASFYDRKIDPKMLAWLHLGAAVGGVYGTRVWAIRNRMKNQRGPAIVKPFPVRPESAPGPVVAPAAAKPASTPSDLYGLSYSAAIPELG